MSTEALSLESSAAVSEYPRVIRRDLPTSKSSKPRVVAWLGHKIEKAVDAACAAVGQEPIGKQIQAEVEFRMRKERPLFIHIEQLQDLVENLLIELSYARVAVAYGKYRARQSVRREMDAQIAAGGGEQLELASPDLTHDLKLRLSFARIGLTLTLSDTELIARLMRSV